MRGFIKLGMVGSVVSCVPMDEGTSPVPAGEGCSGPNVEWADGECVPKAEIDSEDEVEVEVDTGSEEGADTGSGAALEIGGACIDSFGTAGFYDCSGDCYADSVMAFIGDSFCDDGSTYVNLNCEEFAFDGGDC